MFFFTEKMRQKDLEQAFLLEDKIALYTNYLLETGAIQTEPEQDNIEVFLSHFGSYKELISDNCDSVEISRRVLHAVQEISQLSSSLYKSATGLEVPVRPFSCIGGERAHDVNQPRLPTRAETFGGFDERRMKQLHQQQTTHSGQQQSLPTCNDINLMAINHSSSTLHCDDSRSEASFGPANNSSISSASTAGSTDFLTSLGKDHHTSLQIFHYLNTVFSIINQQMTTIASLQAQLGAIRENPKSIYRHNDQLEELRNIQDKLQEEKTAWLKQKEQEDREREELRAKQQKEFEERQQQQEALQKQIKAEQEDIRQQRERLYAQMQKLSNQGILLSPNVAIPSTNIICSDDAGHQTPNSTNSPDDHTDTGGGSSSLSTEHRRKDKWRSASSKYSIDFIFLVFVLIKSQAAKDHEKTREHSCRVRFH